ncbi:MAG: helix-turn-helix transcriptional regulator [Clostridia bacterium]|nr:helix-turn-helix transcriptional regulator [Clostridia bacterium]
MKKFNERLRELREDNNLTQTNLANELMIDQRSLSFYEIGKYEPNLDTLKRMAIFFKVPTDYILGLTNEKEPYPRED